MPGVLGESAPCQLRVKLPSFCSVVLQLFAAGRTSVTIAHQPVFADSAGSGEVVANATVWTGVLSMECLSTDCPTPNDLCPWLRPALKFHAARESVPSRRVGEVSRALAGYDDFGAALLKVTESLGRYGGRDRLAKKIRTDDWYFDKFGLHW